MPERKHNLPAQFNRLDDQITGPVVDAIMISPRSKGTLYLPGEYSTDSRPPAHKVEVVTGEPGSPGVSTDENQLGGPDHYVVNCDIWNHHEQTSLRPHHPDRPAGPEPRSYLGRV
jgi:hypothetical protein